MQPNSPNVMHWCLAGVLGFFLILMFAHFFGQKTPSLVVVDMNRAIQKPSLWLAHSKLTEQAQSDIMRRFSALLPEIIEEYGASHGVTVVGSTVLASNNSVDITDTLVELTIARMKHEP
ncbi:TPA: TrbI F-type domain-containing protein [Legionella anisa]|uniref:TrbI F-type domain-containing protein n=1 Tax=Legionella anisa TaxID=28082 RepID=UPI00197CBE89|nr:TrbI F-type domain-containing protein [Legionella anisa]MBN5937182.1 TrbI F-type domain-containing protein [Legionella anisa]